MTAAIILGTRPEIIKMSPIIRECERKGLDYFVVHSGQHYTYEMDRIFFEQLELPEPNYNLSTGPGSHAEQTGKIMVGTEKIFLKERPNVVLVQGDTNTVLAGALAAKKLNIDVGHVEAGLRSYDRKMPEEINRVLTDHLSNYLFSPTDISRRNLIREGISDNIIFITGNTIVDAVHQNTEIAKRNAGILKKMNLNSKSYFLVTIHRQENVDNDKTLTSIIDGLRSISRNYDYPIILPVHPRTSKKIKEMGLDLSDFTLIDPVGFLDFLQIEANAKLVLTDSGGIQEETCILGVPCVTLRDTTERPETIEVGSNILVGSKPSEIELGVERMLRNSNSWLNPFGNGDSGKKIINILVDFKYP